MQQLIIILHVLVAILIIVLVLLQHGKGADAGAAFGSGASNTMFGSTGTTPVLVKVTALLAAVFFTTSLSLSYLAVRSPKPVNVLRRPGPVMPAVPVVPTQKPVVPTKPKNKS